MMDQGLVTPQVLKESFKIYCAINDGIINLVDKVLYFLSLFFPRTFVSDFCVSLHFSSDNILVSL